MTLIDPRQYTPYQLIFPSGNINAVQGDDYFNVYLLESLSGNFNITGSLKVNGKGVFFPDVTNNFGGSGIYVYGGTNNFATGTNNGIIYAFDSEISGDKNGILFGEQNQIVDASYASVVAGRNTLASHTGAVVIGDSVLARQKNSVKNDSLTIDLTGGVFNQYNLYQKGDFYLDSASSGLSSGNWNFLQGVYKTGSPLQNLQNLLDASGTLASSILLNSGLAKTGLDALSGFTTGKIKEVSGILAGDALGPNYLSITGGDQGVTGYKTFSTGIFVSGDINMRFGSYIGSRGFQFGTYGAVLTLGDTGGTTSDIAGNLGGTSAVLISKESFAIIVDSQASRNKNDRQNQFTKSAFSVHSETTVPGSGVLCFGVDASGLGYVRKGLVISSNRYIPSAYNSSGISGQMTWNPPYFYLCTGANAWGRVAVAAW